AGFTNSTAVHDTLALNGGALRGFASGSKYYLRHLTTNSSGGTLDATGSLDGILYFVATDQSIAINGNSTWGPAGKIQKLYGRELPITIAPAVTLTSFLSPTIPIPGDETPFRVLGGGTLYLPNFSTHLFGTQVFLQVEQGSRLKMDSLISFGSFPTVLTLDNGILQYAGPTA